MTGILTRMSLISSDILDLLTYLNWLNVVAIHSYALTAPPFLHPALSWASQVISSTEAEFNFRWRGCQISASLPLSWLTSGKWWDGCVKHQLKDRKKKVMLREINYNGLYWKSGYWITLQSNQRMYNGLSMHSVHFKLFTLLIYFLQIR